MVLKELLDKYKIVLICAGLLLATIVAYEPVRHNDFVDFDDDLYIIENPHVRGGFSVNNIVWAFTTGEGGNWHPLTWLTHMLDCEIYGLNPVGHHVTNVILHIANTLLCFAVLRSMTGVLWASAFTAGLFALHPVHVESVAWASERKDVLSTFFWLLTMASYVRYTRRGGAANYMMTFALLFAGLMAKAMLVTLPFVLLLMDFWPLGRMKKGKIAALVIEKIPLFVLAAISCVVTLFVQQKWGAVASAELYPFSVRFSNALVAYGNYLFKMVWPHPLAAFYPHPGMPPVWKIAAAGLLLIGISLFSIKYLKQFPYVFTGWFWFVGALVPVIGIVQVGGQAVADRYTYVPLIGMFIIVSWGASDLFRRWFSRPSGIAAAAIGVLLILMVLTGFQVRYWENSITLFEHANAVVPDDFIINSNLGNALARRGRLKDAVAHYLKALALNPGKSADTHNNLGAALLVSGKTSEAMAHFRLALQIQPGHIDALRNIKRISSQKENIKHAIGSP